jgi:hypothetical protein
VNDVAADVAAAALDLAAPMEREFYRWDLDALARWARDQGLALDAHQAAEAVRERFLALIEEAARRAHDDKGAARLRELLVEQAVESYLAGAVAREEWDLDGLGKWADCLNFNLPVTQWRQSEGEEEAFTSLRQQLDVVRETIGARVERAVQRTRHGDLMGRLARFEVARRIDILAADDTEKGGLRRVLQWLERLLEVGVSESDARAAIRAQRDALGEQIARHLAGKLGNQPRERWSAACAATMVDAFLARDLSAPDRDLAAFAEIMFRKYGIRRDPFELSKLHAADIGRTTLEAIRNAYEAREKAFGADRMRSLERHLLLQKIDAKWKDHLLAMDHLKGGIGLRGYAQVDPKVEYTREARALFDRMQAGVRQEVSDLILRLELRDEEEKPESEDIWGGGEAHHAEAGTGLDALVSAGGGGVRAQQEAAIAGTERGEKPQPIRVTRRVGRNAPCPCGSGRKFKHCCGRA